MDTTKINDAKARMLHLFSWAVCVVTVGVINFHDLSVFHRALNARDDQNYIAPLRHMDLDTYLTAWLPDRMHFAFPLRDLIFSGDFWLSETLGFQTFLIGNFLIWAACFYFTAQILRLLLPRPTFLSPALLALLMLHPLNVQLIQWASMRKHLLAVLFMMIGSFEIFKIYNDPKRRVGRSDLFHVAFYALLSDLCWPNAATWPLAVIWLLRKKFVGRQKQMKALIMGAMLSALIYFRLVSGENTDYAHNTDRLFTWIGIVRAEGWAWRSIGRASFNLLAPFREAMYYDANSLLNILGFIAVMAMLSWFVLLTRAKTASNELVTRGWDVLVYAGILMVPQFYFVISSYDFVWDDHYLFGIAPFIVISIAYFIQAAVSERRSTFLRSNVLARIGVATVWLIFAGAYTAYAFTEVPIWTDTLSVFTDCARREQSPTCLIESIEHSFDEGGCFKASSFFGDARKVYVKEMLADTLDYSPQFEFELPLMESICMGTLSNFSVSQKIQMLDELDHVYQRPFSVLFGRVLAYLSAHDLTSAWKVASSTYLDENQRLFSSETVLALLDGQGEALCGLSGAMGQNANCQALLQGFRKRVKPRLVDLTKQVSPRSQMGLAISLDAWSSFNHSGRGK